MTENDDDDENENGNDDNKLHPKILNNYYLPLYIVIYDPALPTAAVGSYGFS